ncbi:protein Dok-7-like isoform X3 [Sphaeramia orbicularis]|uniref:protein Dok-7-like isoform X3 n=1 Tax=Sphaeramia orbicularis TaxID=375764 RepID=UPI00117E5A2B|nr:protein Dok-7 isoform X3 [Sphaeramia orbicularis]
MTDSVVVEGYARLRDGKKWKTRWLVLRKPSPVADCLVLLVFKDKSDKAQGNRERASVTLEEICGLESGQWLEGVAFTLTVLCLNQTALLGFDTREALQAWDARIRYSLGEVHRFSVGVLPGTKLESGPASLHLCNSLLALARDAPPVIIGHWNLPDLRRYGPVPNGFVFEGGTRCGYWAGVFLLASAESEQISFLFDCIVRGISPTRGPFGLRPVLPDLSPNQTNSEEKLNHEAQELEKRLSMLSHRSSTVSSAGGDDRSISGSSDTSDTSQSDCSVGSRLVIWSDPASNPSENTVQLGAKVPPPAAEKLSVNQGVGTRPTTKAPRQLQEIGRQSSSDSGIATGSHSSYSGSFSSYTGSLDITPAEEFGSVFSLPPHLAQDLSPCSCPAIPGHEYQVPTSLRYLYDSPRSLLQEGGVSAKDSDPPTPMTDTPDPATPPAEAVKGDKSSTSASEGHSDAAHRHSVTEHSEDARKTKMAPSSDSQHPESCHICSSLTSASKTIVTICSVCGGYKGAAYIPAVPDKKFNSREDRCRADPAYEIMERTLEADNKPKYELMGSCGQQRFLQDTEGPVFVFPPEVAASERPRGDVTYVNIPVSPTSKKQLNYMELELQEPGPGPRGPVTHLPTQRKSSTKYAQIDITATETAHKVGTQHALGRQEGLHTLELRRKATPH